MKPEAGLTLGGRYELMDRVAVGGMGEVWQAADLHLDRKVAAKVLRAEFAGDNSFLARMRAEARNAAGLSHINVTAMYDYGEQDGAGYLIMELVEGEPMSDLLSRERTLAPGQLLPILAQTARGLHSAHVAGVVHRDVKPSNLLITRDGTVKITDFGIALGANQAPMTAAGMVMGTAQYLPPEQAMGKAAQGVGDIYALGVIAYEALVGRRPFTGSTQVDIAFAHVNQPVPQMPERIDPRVREVVMSMLDKDPERRPRSGASLARILDDLLRALHSEAANGRVAPHIAARTDAAAMATQAMSMGPSSRDRVQLAEQSARQRPRAPRAASATSAAASGPGGLTGSAGAGGAGGAGSTVNLTARSAAPRSSATSTAAGRANRRLRLRVVPAVDGSSALDLEPEQERRIEPGTAAATSARPDEFVRPARDRTPDGAISSRRYELDDREGAEQVAGERIGGERSTAPKAAGVRRPPLPTRRGRTDVPEPTGAPARDEQGDEYAVETPDRGFAPAWAPVGAHGRAAVDGPATMPRPPGRRHGRMAGVWAWQSVVKVLVVAVMLIVLVLWLGTLAQAAALAPALGAAAMLGTQQAPARGRRCRTGTRRRPTSG